MTLSPTIRLTGLICCHRLAEQCFEELAERVEAEGQGRTASSYTVPLQIRAVEQYTTVALCVPVQSLSSSLPSWVSCWAKIGRKHCKWWIKTRSSATLQSQVAGRYLRCAF